MMNDLINTIPKIILFLLCIYICFIWQVNKNKQTNKEIKT